MQLVGASCDKCQGLVQRFDNPYVNNFYSCQGCGTLYMFEEPKAAPFEAEQAAETPWFVEAARLLAGHNGGKKYSRRPGTPI